MRKQLPLAVLATLAIAAPLSSVGVAQAAPAPKMVKAPAHHHPLPKMATPKPKM